MDLQTRKLAFIQKFLEVQNENLVSRLEGILKNEYQAVEQGDLEPMTLEEFNSRIDQSMKDSKNGHLIESSELKAKIDKWN